MRAENKINSLFHFKKASLIWKINDENYFL